MPAALLLSLAGLLKSAQEHKPLDPLSRHPSVKRPERGAKPLALWAPLPRQGIDFFGYGNFMS